MKVILLFFLSACLAITTQGQSTCDSILIHEVKYESFHDDSMVMVVAQNLSSFLVSYPSFILQSQNGDTLAVETVNLFGMGAYKHGHWLTSNMHPLSGEWPNAHLSLYTGFNDSLVCEYDLDVDLCPEICAPFSVFIQGYGTPMGHFEYDYTVKDSLGNLVYSDSLSIDSNRYWKSDSICLEPGRYDVEFTEQVAQGNNLVKGFVQSPWGSRSEEVDNAVELMLLSIDVHRPCYEGTLSVKNERQAQLNIIQRADQIVISKGQAEIGRVRLIDLRGRVLLDRIENASTAFIQTSGFAPGIYLIQVGEGTEPLVRQVFID